MKIGVVVSVESVLGRAVIRLVESQLPERNSRDFLEQHLVHVRTGTPALFLSRRSKLQVGMQDLLHEAETAASYSQPPNASSHYVQLQCV